MIDKRNRSNILRVATSNFITLISGVLIGFVIPKIMGVVEYGYYKTFTLYITYVGLFHLGLSDGVYLYYAGRRLEELNKLEFRSIFKVLLGSQLIFMLIFIFMSIRIVDLKLSHIFVFIAFNIILLNIIYYFQFIAQITEEFNRMTVRNIIKSSLNIILVLMLYLAIKFDFMQKLNSWTYMLVFTIINLIIFISYIISYRSMIFGENIKLLKLRKHLLFLYKTGFVLMLSNFISTLIFTIDRQFVSLLFDIKEYSIYAFAYNMLTLITTIVSALSIVMYPIIKKLSKSALKEKYKDLNIAINIISLLTLLVYFPLVYIVNVYLPNFNGAIEIFRIILPGLVFTFNINVIKLNYFKSLDILKSYFKTVFIVLILSVILNYSCYILFGTTVSISYASIFTIMIWFILSEINLKKELKTNWYKEYTYLVLGSIGFYGITSINSIIVALVILIIYLTVLSFLFYNNLVDIVKKVFSNY